MYLKNRKHMSDLCSADSCQWCSRSVCSEGFLGIHHSNPYMSWVILQLASIPYSGKVRPWQRLTAAWWALCSRWLTIWKSISIESRVCKNEYFTHVLEACSFSAVYRRLNLVCSPLKTPYPLLYVSKSPIPERNTFYLCVYGYQPDDCGCINEDCWEGFQILIFDYPLSFVWTDISFKPFHCTFLIPLNETVSPPVQRCKIFMFSFCNPTAWGKLFVITRRSKELQGQVTHHLWFFPRTKCSRRVKCRSSSKLGSVAAVKSCRMKAKYGPFVWESFWGSVLWMVL